MKFLRHYIRFHALCLIQLYTSILLKTDKHLFAILFNIKSLLFGSKARLAWNGSTFIVTDKNYHWFCYKIRHQHVCNTAYEWGILKRTKRHASCYFLEQIGFQKGDIFLDCGANVGDLKLWFKLNGIDIQYIGFEPSPIEFKCLQENVNPSKVHNVALWHKEGELKFYVSSQGGDSGLIKSKKPDHVTTCKACRLENFVESKIKCLKLEAEGAEPEVLEGLGNKLKLIEYITADLGPERGEKAESTLAPVTNFLLNKGFELIDVQHTRISALFRNKNFEKL